MRRRVSGITLVEMIIVLAVFGILVVLIASRLSTGQIEVNQAMERVARSVQRARLHAVERNAFTLVTFDPAAQRIVVARLGDADDLSSGTAVTVHDFAQGELEDLSFTVEDGLATPAGLLFDPRGVGQGILSAGSFVGADQIRVTIDHEGNDATGTFRVNRYAAVEVMAP